MTLKIFVRTYNLSPARLRRDVDGTSMLCGRETKSRPGVRAVHEYGDGRLSASFLDLTPRRWGTVRRALEDVGCELMQDGDDEGSLTFDPKDAKQVRAVLKHVGIPKKRSMSETQREALAKARAA